MPETATLALPLLVAEQAQKHVTHNEALRALDAIVQTSVKDRDLATPPGSPADGDRYIVAATATATDEWAGHEDEIAAWQDGAWAFYAPREGWRSWVDDEDVLLVHDGAGWTDYSLAIAVLQNLSRLGVGTVADATNPFAAKLNKALWTALTTGEGGDGDLRYTLNKESAADVLSLLLQSGFSGRAEIGLIGDDDLSIKVSHDGSAWSEAVRIDKGTGAVDFPSGSTALPKAGGAMSGNIALNGNWLSGDGGNEGVAVAADGKVGIGTQSPGSALTVVGNIAVAQGSAIRLAGSTANQEEMSSTATGTLDFFARGRVLFCGDSNNNDVSTAVIHDFRHGGPTVAGASTLWGIEKGGTMRPGADDVYDLGTASFRLDDIYATNGTIQTSDAGDKAVRGALSAAEIAAGRRMSPVVFRWLSSVAEKGAAAREHVGFVAQDVRAALTAEGLEPGPLRLLRRDPADGAAQARRRLAPGGAGEDAEGRARGRGDCDPRGKAGSRDGDGDGGGAGPVEDEAGRAVPRPDGKGLLMHFVPEMETVTEEEESEELAPMLDVRGNPKTRLGLRMPELMAFLDACRRAEVAALDARVAALEAAAG